MGLGFGSWGIYLAIAAQSGRFEYGVERTDEPIPLVLFLFALAVLFYLRAVRTAVVLGTTPQLRTIMLGFALAFRGLLVFTPPLMEIDLYRYLWDGQVAAAGGNPFRFSPSTVVASDEQTEDEELRLLVGLRDSSPGAREALYRVHFPELTTVYPPVSQAVFAAAAWSSPANADIVTLRLVLKGWLLAFDHGTVLLIAELLRWLGKPAGWLVGYAWCPLVLKEFANSGHLDTIAVFWMVAAVVAAMRALYSTSRSSSSGRVCWCAAATVCLALGVGAKLFPVVLAPLLLAAIGRRLGFVTAIGSGLLFVTATAFLISPWLPWPIYPPIIASENPDVIPAASSPPLSQEDAPAPPLALPPPFPEVESSGRDPAASSTDGEPPSRETDHPAEGVTAFLTRWKMNDFLFLILDANLHAGTTDDDAGPWFVVTPASWRHAVTDLTGQASPRAASFLLARAITVLIFLALGLLWTIRASRAENGRIWCRQAFLTLAWFWLLSPTLNPWYWTWAIPFLPFARARSWWLMSGLCLLYYLRFWLGEHWPEPGLLGTPYAGHAFFDYVVVWIEFAPWFALLFFESRKLRRAPQAPQGRTKSDVSG